jgi:integrase
MPRKRSGELYQSKGQWFARVTTRTDGATHRTRHALRTEIKAVARVRLDALLRGETPGAAETFAQAARRVVNSSAIVTRSERLSRLERYALPALGATLATKVRASHVREVLEAAAARGLGRSACRHLLDDIGAVLDSLWRDEVVPENVARRVQIPDAAKRDRRPRVVLTDLEFARLMAWQDLSPPLRTMCMVSRYLGGMRTSDLHAWDWSHVDTVDWAAAEIPRPKTLTRSRLELPAPLVPILYAWWLLSARPRSGPVFPSHTGERRGKRSHVRELRRALWRAGVRRGEAIETCALQSDTETTRRIDFHGFRRAYATGLALAGVNNQLAMALAGHSSPQTHARYVRLVETLSAPAAALPASSRPKPDRLN